MLKTYEFDIFIVKFKIDFNHKIYENEYHKGILFHDSEARYDLVHNKGVSWSRLMVNRKDGSWNDYPFHEGTFHFLPIGIEVRRYR